MAHRAAAKAEQLRKVFAGPMSPAEIQFCRDVQSFIDFAIANGLSFPLVVSTVGHDCNNLARYGMSLEQAEKDAFMPQVSGYQKMTSDDVGQAEEIDDNDASAA